MCRIVFTKLFAPPIKIERPLARTITNLVYNTRFGFILESNTKICIIKNRCYILKLI